MERLPGRTPLILIEVPGARRSDDTVLLYGHLDKQPEMTGWAEGKGPWIPVLEGDKLYGRGGADDGYAMFGALAALLALKQQRRAARARGDRDRSQRRERLAGFAVLHGCAGGSDRRRRRWSCAWIAAAATMSGCG